MTFREMIRYYLTLVAGVHNYLKTPVNTDPETVLQEQLKHREQRWLNTVNRVVFERPDHPYHRMFKLAGCTYEDLADSVGREGLESTLLCLRNNGVYLTHDELKGKTPIVRFSTLSKLKSFCHHFRQSFSWRRFATLRFHLNSTFVTLVVVILLAWELSAQLGFLDPLFFLRLPTFSLPPGK